MPVYSYSRVDNAYSLELKTLALIALQSSVLREVAVQSSSYKTFYKQVKVSFNSSLSRVGKEAEWERKESKSLSRFIEVALSLQAMNAKINVNELALYCTTGINSHSRFFRWQNQDHINLKFSIRRPGVGAGASGRIMDPP